MSFTFQGRAQIWQERVFDEEFVLDIEEWNHRFGEEALETLQACGWTFEQVVQMALYVFGRPVGEVKQEIGGAMVSLAGLATSHGVDMMDCAEAELTRISTPEMMEKIKAKRSGKPKMIAFSAPEAKPEEPEGPPINFIAAVNFSVGHLHEFDGVTITGRHPGVTHRATRRVRNSDRGEEERLQAEIVHELWEARKQNG